MDLFDQNHSCWPSASNLICSLHCSGYKEIIQNQIFSFAHMLFFPGFPDFRYSFELPRKLHNYSQFQCNFHHSTIHNQRTVFNLKLFFKNLSCSDTFSNLYNSWSRKFWFTTNEKMYIITIINYRISDFMDTMAHMK